MNGNKTSWLLSISAAILIFAAPSMSAAQTSSATVGIFEDHGDVGEVLHPGTAEYDPATASYKISGSGANIWFATDAFHFVWKKVSGDVSLTADAAFVTPVGNPHKKAVLMFRQSLDADSPYVDVAGT